MNLLSPEQIISWLSSKVNCMRRSRLKTLAALVRSAARRCGVGVLALGRAMMSGAGAKHCIKRVWRFLRNKAVETHAVLEAVFKESLPRHGPLVVLIDWTELPPYRSLVMALARSGRAIPFFSLTVNSTGRGSMVAAEAQALRFLRRCVPCGRQVILIADRGFANSRWMRQLASLGWGYVLRLKKQVLACSGEAYCKLSHWGLRRGSAPWCWGKVTISDSRPTLTRLVTVWRADAAEPWYLATNLESGADAIVELYSRRMWIELTIRDLKNRKWGIGLGEVRLSAADRHDRHFLVVFLAYFFLCAFGAAAEERGLDRQLKANTVSSRVLSVATIGFLVLASMRITIDEAVSHLPWEVVV
jgi:hypothetical protein